MVYIVNERNYTTPTIFKRGNQGPTVICQCGVASLLSLQSKVYNAEKPPMDGPIVGAAAFTGLHM